MGPTLLYHELAPDVLIELHFDEEGKVDHCGLFVSPWAFQRTSALPEGKHNGEQEPPEARTTKGEPPVKFTKEDERAFVAWRRQGGPENVAQFAGMCLRHRLSRARIARLIGGPARDVPFRDTMPRAMAYDYMPSQSIVFLFDEKDYVTAALVGGSLVSPDGSLAP